MECTAATLVGQLCTSARGITVHGVVKLSAKVESRMNREQINDLANFIWEGGLHLADIKGSVEQWLEQNPLVSVETKVVGLTDEQVAEAFASPYIPKDIRDDLIVIFKNWLKTQTFAVREIPVGLSDEQIQSLVDYTYCDSDTFNTIKEWAKTQTFAQPHQQFQPNWDDDVHRVGSGGCGL
jgi:hypothetical protein